MEIWDILDENGEKTGRTMVRGGNPKHGEYYLAVHIWIRNGRGEYLIQKRSDTKPLWPGMWAATGGAAISGEDSLDAALREVEEELGIKADQGNMRLIKRLKRKGTFADVWLLESDIPLEKIIMQQEEVSDVRWVSMEELKAMIRRKEFLNYSYVRAILG